jgi:hypothetical protein
VPVSVNEVKNPRKLAYQAFMKTEVLKMIKKRLLKADITVREIIEMIDSVLYIGEKEEESR